MCLGTRMGARPKHLIHTGNKLNNLKSSKVSAGAADTSEF